MKYVVVSGTNRPKPNSRILAELFAGFLRELGAETSIVDLTDLPDDFVFSALYDLQNKNSSFNSIKDLLNKAEKLVFIMPEYNGSFPGVLKAFIDGLDYPQTFKGKKAALVGHSAGGQGGLLALSHLTDILNYMGTHVLAAKTHIPDIEKHLSGNQLAPRYLSRMKRQAEMLVQF